MKDRKLSAEEIDGQNEDEQPRMRRLTINLPPEVFNEIKELSEEAQIPMSILMRNAFALMKFCYDKTRKGKKVVFHDESDKPVTEIILPLYKDPHHTHTAQ